MSVVGPLLRNFFLGRKNRSNSEETFFLIPAMLLFIRPLADL